MSQGFQSPGGRATTDSAAQAGSIPAGALAGEPQHALQVLFSQIACDSAALMEMLQELIESAGPAGNQLAAACAMLGRVGLCADAGASATGGTRWHRSALDWLVPAGTGLALAAVAEVKQGGAA